ncbi:MAG: hypothetical protein ACREQZ_05550 [Woeseiaceae bacterium]
MRRRPSTFYLILATLPAFLACPGIAPARAEEAPRSRALFESAGVLAVRLEAPIGALMRERSESEYLDGFLRYAEADGGERVFDLKVRPRGRYRRQKDVCDLPPLRLNFRKKQVEGTLFDGQDKLKLVTHCDNSRVAYEYNVLKEYLGYRILNIMTPLSFRVRLLRVDYADTGTERKARTKYAFLIEDEEEMANRLGLQEARVKSLTFEQLEPGQAALVSVFQYLIGNTDYSMLRGPRDTHCCHNIVLLIDERGRYVPVPYDFDFSGLVDAPYAGPNPELDIETVTDRLYRGYCGSNDLLAEAVAAFVAQRDAITQLIDGLDGLPARNRRSAGRFIDQFYARVSTPERIERYLFRECL